MNKFLCVLSLLAFASGCGMAGNEGNQYPVGSLQLNNKTTWTVIDVSTDEPNNAKFCVIGLAPGDSLTINEVYAPPAPRLITVVFKDVDGTVTAKSYQVTVAPNAVTVVDLEGLCGCEGYAPPSGTVTVYYH